MPIVRIDIQSGKSTAYKRAILRGIREAIVDALGVDHERVSQRIVETDAENIDAPEIRTERLTVIEISMLPGRGEQMKSELFRQIIRHLGFDPGIAEHDIVVVVNDPPAECFCIGGTLPGAAAAETSVDVADAKSEDVEDDE